MVNVEAGRTTNLRVSDSMYGSSTGTSNRLQDDTGNYSGPLHSI